MINFGRNSRGRASQESANGPAEAGSTPAAAGWRPETNAAQNGGQPGGEVQYGEASAVRLRNPATRSAFIDLATYAARVDDEAGAYLLELQVRWTITAWPPLTRQLWTAAGTWVQPSIWTYADAAVREAGELAAEMASGQRSIRSVLAFTFGIPVADQVCDWDGRPFSLEGE